MSAHLLTFYTRTPLHAGSGLSVDVVDLPFARERVTQFPVIPPGALWTALRDAGRQQSGADGEPRLQSLFGETPALPHATQTLPPGARFHLLEAKLLAFPVRALKGCFAWLTCPAILHRFHRDTGRLPPAEIPSVAPERALVATRSDLVRDDKIFLEDFRLQAEREPSAAHRAVVAALRPLCDDTLWLSRLATRLAIVNDEDFQHFVTTCTDVVQRAAVDPVTRRIKPGSLYSQENLPCETLFYSVLTPLAASPEEDPAADAALSGILNATLIVQIGSDQTTGLGFCALKHEPLS